MRHQFISLVHIQSFPHIFKQTPSYVKLLTEASETIKKYGKFMRKKDTKMKYLCMFLFVLMEFCTRVYSFIHHSERFVSNSGPFGLIKSVA